jgi:hypothetical protein
MISSNKFEFILETTFSYTTEMGSLVSIARSQATFKKSFERELGRKNLAKMPT